MVCNSNPPPCLSWAVRSSSLSAERFLVRPLRMGSGGGGSNGTLGFYSHLTSPGRFRPPLSWPYSEIFSAEKIEPFGQWPAGRGEIETRFRSNPPAAWRRPRRPKGPEGVFPRRELQIAPQG